MANGRAAGCDGDSAGVRSVEVNFAAALVLLLGWAQTQDRTQPPLAGSLRAYKLPPFIETQLPNGLAVLLVNDPRVPLVTVRLAFACGNRRDPKEMPGLAGAVADMLTTGTKTRGSMRIVEALDDLGGSIGAASGADHIVIDGSINAESAPELIAIMADVARNAEFPEIDLRLYKQRRRQTLAQQRSQPAFAANEEFRKALFGDRPYAHIGPTEAALERMDRKALLDYRDQWMLPNNAFLIMVGKLPADTMKSIADGFGSWARKPLPELTSPPLPTQSATNANAPRLILVDRPGAAEAVVRIGKLAGTQRDPDYFAEVAASLAIREVNGAASGSNIHAEAVAFDEAGILSSFLQVRNEDAAEALPAMMDRLNRMSEEPVSSQQMANLKSLAAGSFLLRLETQAGLADELMVGRLQRLPARYPETEIPRIESVGPDEIKAAAKKFLSTPGSVMVVVGDAAKLRQSLAGIGKFEVVK
jgi:zinc protease